MPRSAIMITRSLKLNVKLVPADTKDADPSIEMPSVEQCFEQTRPTHHDMILHH
jgi:hypothetical protein